MSPTEANEWLNFIQKAPEHIRYYLEATLWLLVLLILIWAILKILQSKDFKTVYMTIRSATREAGAAAKVVAKSAARNLELPEPYPRAARLLSIISMLNDYIVSIIFTLILALLLFFLATSSGIGFWARNVGLIISAFLAYFPCFFSCKLKESAYAYSRTDSI